ncbi:MAG: type II toxin-antitoxin system Phd/YefM family antitoxin [Acidimicrobiia bacterium]|nr:type II toxin-antitoxin system Phd/YefM family antitoxin [Acidimicrobiia bacterium]
MKWTKLSPIMPNIHEAKTHFSKLVQRAAAGEEIIITRSGVPMAKLVPFRETQTARVPGVWKGRVRIAADFDTTPDEVIATFEDGE